MSQKKQKSIEDLEYRTVLMVFMSTQLWLEIQDDLEGSFLERPNLKEDIKKLENQMESYLGPLFDDLYVKNELSFSTYLNYLEKLMKWVSESKFEDVIDLTKALTTGQIKFE